MATETGFAAFDSSRKLKSVNQAFLDLITGDGATPDNVMDCDCEDLLARILRSFDQLDGAPLHASDPEAQTPGDTYPALIARWAASESGPMEALGADGRWHLLTSHPRYDGGTTFIAVDISARKEAELAQRDSDEMLRLITDSHPLPVWVADIETGEIIYESLSASNMLGRNWDPGKPQFIAGHYLR